MFGHLQVAYPGCKRSCLIGEDQDWTPVVFIVDGVKQRADFDWQVEFLQEFSSQRLLWRFPFLEFAAREFPVPGMARSFRSARDQDLTILFYDRGSDDERGHVKLQD
jgi:hypothetical protein